MGAQEKSDATYHGVGDTAALIAEARDYVGKDRTYDSQLIRALADALEAAQAEAATAYADRDAALERLGAVLAERDSLSRLHEEATKRTVALSAVIEKAKAAPYHDIVRDGIRTQSVYSVLSSAPGDVLREHDAKVLEDAATAIRKAGAFGPIVSSSTARDLEAQAAALRVGANPKENEHG